MPLCAALERRWWVHTCTSNSARPELGTLANCPLSSAFSLVFPVSVTGALSTQLFKPGCDGSYNFSLPPHFHLVTSPSTEAFLVKEPFSASPEQLPRSDLIIPFLDCCRALLASTLAFPPSNSVFVCLFWYFQNDPYNSYISSQVYSKYCNDHHFKNTNNKVLISVSCKAPHLIPLLFLHFLSPHAASTHTQAHTLLQE